MHSHVLPLAVSLALSAHCAAQDVLYYKYDEAGGKKVVNFASATMIAPAEGTLVGTAQFAPGRLGTASLAAGNGTSTTVSTYVDTGWFPNLPNVSCSFGFFLRQRYVSTGLNYFLYALSSGFRLFTNGVASRGLLLRTGGTIDVQLNTDIQTMSAAGWVHVACVVDAVAATGTWYVNGVAQPPVALAGGATIISGTGSFHANGYSTGVEYDTDEFRFALRVASATEIAGWAVRTSPADGPYGAGCLGGVLASTGGAPKLGNPLYMLKASGGSLGNVCALAMGSSRSTMGSLALPFDLGLLFPALAGCNWESSADVALSGVFLVGGVASFPLPIPNNIALDGVSLFLQAVGMSSTTVTLTTNGLAIGLGQ